jgi:ABC-type transport system involved in multi-copper enzyme maturation permease subunit
MGYFGLASLVEQAATGGGKTMIYWKEWCRLRRRFFALAAFYLITALFLPPVSWGTDFLTWTINLLIGWGGGLLLVPAILGMDAWAGEKDEGTETFLFSKPIPAARLLLAKLGLRLLLTLLITSVVLGILILRLEVMGVELHLFTRPYTAASALATVVAAQLTLLAVTMLVSIRAPYQSTALIIGGCLGAAIAGAVVLPSFWRVRALQAIWPSFWMLVALSLVMLTATAWLLLTRDIKGVRP